MLKLHDLPTLNAVLNSISAVLIVIGYFLIRARRIDAHRKTMLAAFTTSTLFLISYLVYHAQVGSVRFPRDRCDPYRLFHDPDHAHDPWRPWLRRWWS